ncbi:YlxR family protein [Nocardioides sp. C4-1]|uniref:YlxR family protein n=1 Tax=Nocardioides sp. C4-1 TaxID=3151851 RepID=UPI0032676FA0
MRGLEARCARTSTSVAGPGARPVRRPAPEWLDWTTVVQQSSSPVRPEPVRTCVGCRRRAAKRELLRVTAGSDADGRPAAVPDPTATAPGRGAHLHPTTECFDLAVRRKAFGRALRAGPHLSGAPVGEYLASTTGTTPSADR